MSAARTLIADLQALADPDKAAILSRFFKTGKGQYGEGDTFWGITVPRIRTVACKHRHSSLPVALSAVRHRVHEVRLCGLLMLVDAFKNMPDDVFQAYIDNIPHVNNWDLVDLTAPHIVGAYLADKDRTLLYEFAQSDNIWKRRIAIVATFFFLRRGECADTLAIATMLLRDTHDLIHKAAGWMLREAGKRCGTPALEGFLTKHAPDMPRTMLRYAVERLSPEQKKHFMTIKKR